MSGELQWPDPSTFSRIVRFIVEMEHKPSKTKKKWILLVPPEYGVYYTLQYLWKHCGMTKYYADAPSFESLAWWVSYTQMDIAYGSYSGGNYHSDAPDPPTSELYKRLDSQHIAPLDQAFTWTLRAVPRMNTTIYLNMSSDSKFKKTNLKNEDDLDKFRQSLEKKPECTITCFCLDHQSASNPNEKNGAHVEGIQLNTLDERQAYPQLMDAPVEDACCLIL